MAGPSIIGQSQPSGSTSRLIAGLQAGEPLAWRQFVQLYGPAVYHWCRRWPLSREDVADVFQDVFATVHRGLADFRRGDPQHSLRGWLWTITRSRAIDQLRRKEREPSAAGGSAAQELLLSAAEVESTDAPPAVDLRAVHAAEALIRAEFEERTWQLFARSVLDGQDTASVAAEFGVTPGAVRQARYRVLKRLREELEGL